MINSVMEYKNLEFGVGLNLLWAIIEIIGLLLIILILIKYLKIIKFMEIGPFLCLLLIIHIILLHMILKVKIITCIKISNLLKNKKNNGALYTLGTPLLNKKHIHMLSFKEVSLKLMNF